MTDRGSSIADQLAAHLRAGTTLDLIQHQPADTLLGEAEMQAWDDSHNIEANLIRDLLRGYTVSDPDPRGLRLRRGRICARHHTSRSTPHRRQRWRINTWCARCDKTEVP